MKVMIFKELMKGDVSPVAMFFLILITAGFVVLLTTLTFFSTPILETIFGNGMVEVGNV